MKHFKYFLFIFSFTLNCHYSWAGLKNHVILVDPGHGGEDCGAKAILKNRQGNKTVCEKDLALMISKRLNLILKKKYHSYLTRSIDRTLSLDERAQLADKVNADYFISLHVNAHESGAPNGLEIFYLDNHNDVAVKKIEGVENKDLKGENVIINQILADLVIQRTAPISKSLAEKVHDGIRAALKLKYKIEDRGPKPALFYVLALSKRPSILIEVGFISNSRDLKMMTNINFQELFASGIARGIDKFIFEMDKKRDGPSLL